MVVHPSEIKILLASGEKTDFLVKPTVTRTAREDQHSITAWSVDIQFIFFAKMGFQLLVKKIYCWFFGSRLRYLNL